ncbi:MAG: hypothetical protein RIC30_20305, partial [Marinoscillum sp.]
TFSPEAFIATQGSTDNLMDYLSAGAGSSSGATHLYKHQWDNVHNPEGVTSWLQDDEEGEMEGEQNPVESFVSEKLTTLNLNAEQQVAGYLYCRKCDEEVRDFQEVSISSSLTEVIYQRLKCLLYTFNVTEDGFNSEEEGDIDLTDQSQLSLGEIRILSLMETSESTQALFGVLKSNELLPCSKFIDDYFDSFDYCDQSLGTNEKDLLLNSLAQCIGSQATGKNPNELVENVKRTLRSPLSPNERITVTVKTEGGQEVLGHPNESESLFTVTIDQQGVLDLTISEEFLRNLGFTDPSIIAEIIRNLDDLVDEAKIKFCGDSKVNPQCVSEVFEFLQLMSLNLEHIAKAGVMHAAMWKSDDPVRHLIPEKGKWSPLVGGAIDGGVESAMGIPILVSTLGQLIIFEDQKNAALQIFTAAGFDRLKEAVASEIVEVFTNDERREYTITKASVELALSYYMLLGKAAKGLNEVLEKVGTLGNKLEKCPSLRKYVQQSVEGKDVVRLKKFDDLATEVGSEKLEAIFSRVDVEKLDDLLDDLSESVNFKTALANEPELVDSWAKLDNWGRPSLKKDIPTLESLQKIPSSDKLKGVFDDDFLKAMSDVQKTAGTGSVPAMKELFDNIESAFKGLDLTKVEGIDLLKNELKRTDYGKMIGSNWTLEYMGKNADLFKGFDKIVFESVEKIDDVTGSVIRRIDVKTTKGVKDFFFEFKSVQPPLPPKGFADQFVKDLKLGEVNSLDQLRWVFDGKKVDELVQQDFVNALKSSKNDLFNSKAKNLFEDALEESFIDADDLIDAIGQNDSWFKQVFQKVE